MYIICTVQQHIMNYQEQFYDACEANDLTVIVDLLNNYNIDVHARCEYGFRLACAYGYLNVVQYLLENDFNIDVHVDNELGFEWACINGHLNIAKYILTKTNMTTEIVKIMCRYFDKNDIIKYNYVIKLYNNKLNSFKVLFALYNTINVENAIYFGII